MQIDTAKLQQVIIENKRQRGWNTTDVNFELLQLDVETSELFEATLKADSSNIGEELADCAIFLLGIAEMEKVDLGQAITSKVAINQHRVYDAEGHKHLANKG